MSLSSLFRSKTQQDKIAEVARQADSDTQKSATIYFIRHGEKPPKLDNSHDVVGLSPDGKKRAQRLVKVFGKDSKYNISYIFAQQFKSSGARKRAYDTVHPLSKHLNIPIDHSIDRDNTKAVIEALKGYKGQGNIMVCWEHHALTKIMKKLGVEGHFIYPKKRFDIIWTVRPPYKQLHSWTSEDIEGLDDKLEDP